jgi:hypothetical protein
MSRGLDAYTMFNQFFLRVMMLVWKLESKLEIFTKMNVEIYLGLNQHPLE